MATYYVRRSGNDASAGTSAGAAWATIGKALGASGIASGDTVYIGAGIYREAVTVGFTPSGTTSVIGDVDGAKTGDAGEVRWTGMVSDFSGASNGIPPKNPECSGSTSSISRRWKKPSLPKRPSINSIWGLL